MKRSLLLCVGAVASAALCNVSAVTVDDLMASGGWAVQTIRSQDAINDQYEISGGCRLQRVDGMSDRIMLTGFFEEDGPSFVFTLSGNTLRLADKTASSNKPEYTIRPFRHYGYADYGYLGSDWVGTITTDGDDYVITFPHFGFLKNGQIKFSYEDNGPKQHIYNSFELRVYKPDLFISDDVYDQYGSSRQASRFYRGRLNPDNLSILNFSNDGYALTSTNRKQEVRIAIYDDGDWGIQRQAAVRGPLFADQNSTTFMKWINYDYVGWDRYGVYNEFYGTPEDYVGHLHNHNHWVHHVDGGRLATVAGVYWPLSDYTTYWTGSIYGSAQEWNNFVVKNTKIYWVDDITPHIEIKDVRYGSDPVNGIYVSGSIVPTMQNLDIVNMPQYIDHYELHIVPGAHTSVSNKSTNSATGLSNGVSIHSDEFDTDFGMAGGQRAAALSPTDEIKFNKLIPASKLPAGFTFNNGHTLYVKTVYTADSGLTPSFHALTPLNRTTTGVEDITGGASADVTVTTGPGSIIVDGTDSPVSIFTASGVKVYSGAATTVSVAPGVYIVTTGAHTSKVSVR